MLSLQFRKTLLKAIKSALHPFGFQKIGTVYSVEVNDVILFVQLYSSSRSTNDKLIVTLDLGVFSKTLASRLVYAGRPRIADSHWKMRIDNLSPGQNRWWEVSSESEAERVAEELRVMVETVAVRALFALDSTDKLKEVWLTGSSPGISNGTRQKYLDAL